MEKKNKNGENAKRNCDENGRGPPGPRAVRTDCDCDGIVRRRQRIINEIKPKSYSICE